MVWRLTMRCANFAWRFVAMLHLVFVFIWIK